jgi:uncharacterized protein (TIGR00725 family)
VKIAVLGSSLPEEGTPEYERARALGREIAGRGGTVLCGGYGGVMEAACRGASEAGGEAIGVVLEGGAEPNRWVTRRIVAEDLAARLRRLRDLAEAWIFLPRGLGTMLELLWIAESIVKGQTPPRPLVLLGDFWQPTLETALAEASSLPGAEKLRACIRVVEDPSSAVAAAGAIARAGDDGVAGGV